MDSMYACMLRKIFSDLFHPPPTLVFWTNIEKIKLNTKIKRAYMIIWLVLVQLEHCSMEKLLLFQVVLSLIDIFSYK